MKKTFSGILKLSMLCLITVGVMAQSPPKKRGFFERVNDGLDKANRGLNKTLGYFQVIDKWEYFGGGDSDSFGNGVADLKRSPFNKHYKAELYAGSNYNVILKSKDKKMYGILVVDAYGQGVYNSTSYNSEEINDIFAAPRTGIYDIHIYTARREHDALYDQGGSFEFGINTKSIAEEKMEKVVLKNENFGELGGGGSGNGINFLGGSVDTRIYSPRNNAYTIELAPETPFHVITETFNIKTLITIVDQYGNIVGSGANEARCHAASNKGGKFTVSVSTEAKDARGRYNIYFAGKIIGQPTLKKHQMFTESLAYKVGEVRTLKIYPEENAVFDFMITSLNNSCNLSVANNVGQVLQTYSNQSDQAVIVSKNEPFWTVTLKCAENYSGKFSYHIFGDFTMDAPTKSAASNEPARTETITRNQEKQTPAPATAAVSETEGLEDLIYEADKNSTYENHLKLGRAYLKAEKYDSAIFQLNWAEKLGGNTFDVNYQMGRAYFGKASDEDYDTPVFKETLKKAVQYFEAAHALKPTDCMTAAVLNTSYSQLRMNKKVNCSGVVESTAKKHVISGNIAGRKVTNKTVVYAVDGTAQSKIYGEVNAASQTFTIGVPEIKDYWVYVEEKGKLGNSILVSKDEVAGKINANKKLELIDYEAGSSITFRNINFQSGRSTLLPESYEELDKVVAFLKEKGNPGIEVVGHTDDVGSEAENLRLSKERAEAVSFYMIAKGFPKTSVTVRGFGKGQPVVRASDEKSRYLNRRVEFKLK